MIDYQELMRKDELLERYFDIIASVDPACLSGGVQGRLDGATRAVSRLIAAYVGKERLSGEEQQRLNNELEASLDGLEPLLKAGEGV